MPHALSITDGTTTISLSTSNVTLRQYAPKTPRRDNQGRLQDVTEPVDIVVGGASTSAMRTNAQAIERMLEQARLRSAVVGAGPRIYFQFQPSDEATVWRSELRDGALDWESDALRSFGQKQLWGRLTLTRAPWWEGARTQIPLSNGNGTNNTSGLAIDNGAGNWVGIAAAAVAGSLPAPLELQLQNTNGASKDYYEFRVANNVFAPTMDNHIEGEERYSNGTIQALSGASGGQVLSVAVPGYVLWYLPAALLSAVAGRQMQLLMRLTLLTSGVQVFGQAAVRTSDGTVQLAQSPQMLLSAASFVQDLGLLPLPPGGMDTNWAQLMLWIYFSAASAATVVIDYLAFAPAEEQRNRHLIMRDSLVANNEWIVDDGIEGKMYLIRSGANHPVLTARTPPVHVQPGVDQRVYIWEGGSGCMANWTMAAKAFYRPRRLTF